MKVRILLLVFVAVAALSSLPAIATTPMILLDPLVADGSIMDPYFYGAGYTGRWHDERPDPDYIIESPLSAPGAWSGLNGSMGIDFGISPPQWDRELRGYFKLDPDNPQYAPELPPLRSRCIAWWEYKENVLGSPNLPEEGTEQLILFTPTGLARFSPTDATETGWRRIVTAPIGSAGWSYEGNFIAEMDLGLVDTFNFWVSSWEANEGNRVLIDDLWLVPEPATMIMLGLGGLALLRRKKA